MPENNDAWILWQEVKTQWRAGGMGVVGLDYAEARYSCTEELDMTWSRGLKRKIQALENNVLSNQGKKEDEE